MRLLDELREFLHREHVLASDRTGAPVDVELMAATALLLLEAAHGDEEYVWREHRAIVNGLKHAFGLGKAEARQLLERSEEIRPPRVRLAEVTQVIFDRYDEAQRLEIVRLLWDVVEADGIVKEWEDVFATHVAQTVGISNEAAVAARQEVKLGR
jgi:uncharacterized tellurite resistance protein B-like protein